MKTKTKVILSLSAALVLLIAFLAVWVLVIVPKQEEENNSQRSRHEMIAEMNENIDFNTDNGMLYVNCEAIVLAAEDSTQEDLEDLAEEYDATLDVSMADIGMYRFIFSEGMKYSRLTDVIDEIKEEGSVDDAFLNTVVEANSDEDEEFEKLPAVTPDDPWKKDDWDTEVPRGNNWGMEAIDAPGAWAYLDRMRTVKVGLIDSLPNEDHEDLTFQNLTSLFRLDEDGSLEVGTYEANLGDHGSHVAGIMSADWDNGTGVSGVMGGKGELYYCGLSHVDKKGKTYSDYKTAYDYLHELKTLIDQDVQVINVSQNTSRLVGFAASHGNKNAQNYLKANAFIAERGLERIIESRYNEGKPDFVICVAAGNSNSTEYYKDDKEVYGYREKKTTWESIFGATAEKGGSLAYYNNFLSMIDSEDVLNRIIVVGAAEIDFSKSKAAETIYKYTDYSNVGDRVDVVAPGTDVYSTIGSGYKLLSGTSMACPHVSGVAGLIFACNEDLTGPQVKSIVTSSTSSRFFFSGGTAGMINANDAVIKALMSQGKPVERLLGMASKGLDLCFVVDTTGSMGDDIDDARANMEKILGQMAEKTSDYRVALIDYRDFSSRTGDSNDYPSKIQLPFTSDNDAIKKAINDLDLGFGGDGPETVFSGLMSTLELDWRKDAKKVIVLLGDAPPLDPEPETNYTYKQVLIALYSAKIGVDFEESDERVLKEDESLINVYAIGTNDSAEAGDFFQQLAEETGGGYSSVRNANEVGDAIVETIDQIEIIEAIPAKLSFDASMANKEIDLYQDGEYLLSFKTDSLGSVKLENMEPKEYEWKSTDTYEKGTFRVYKSGKKPVINKAQEYWITPIASVWMNHKALVLILTMLSLAFWAALPSLIAKFVLKGAGAAVSAAGGEATAAAQATAATQPTQPVQPTQAETTPEKNVAQEPASEATANKFCPYCGKPMKGMNKFCVYCGKKVLDDEGKS